MLLCCGNSSPCFCVIKANLFEFWKSDIVTTLWEVWVLSRSPHQSLQLINEYVIIWQLPNAYFNYVFSYQLLCFVTLLTESLKTVLYLERVNVNDELFEAQTVFNTMFLTKVPREETYQQQTQTQCSSASSETITDIVTVNDNDANIDIETTKSVETTTSAAAITDKSMDASLRCPFNITENNDNVKYYILWQCQI